jgi:hypothetical protein
MPPPEFEYLPLLLRYKGKAILPGGGKTSPQTLANQRVRRQEHADSLLRSANALAENWTARQRDRAAEDLPVIAAGVPILLEIDSGLDLDVLREKFDFEIVSEEDDGYVIVASERIDVPAFMRMVNEFAGEAYGSANVAKIHRFSDDPTSPDRLGRILSEGLFQLWPQIDERQNYVVDVGIACSGTHEIPVPPKARKREDDASWARRQAEWAEARVNAYNAWDAIKETRENEITRIVHQYGGEILHLIDGGAYDSAVLPDSFSVRLRVSGRALKDFVLTYPFVFEVVEPEIIGTSPGPKEPTPAGPRRAEPIPPEVDAPAVCIIDSGIQEAHALIRGAIDTPRSHCFLVDRLGTEVADLVAPGGHGTRVAGAVLYGEITDIPERPVLPFWIQNARVLNEENKMPETMFPPEVISAVVKRFHDGDRKTRIFNHSINANAPSRIRHMSAWAAEIDLLSYRYDVLIVQSSGNLATDGANGSPGVRDHLHAGRDYPAYLHEPSSRVANPGQSLQALTVGSVAYGGFDTGDWTSFATENGQPSAFSRCGPAIWNVVKPEVVEYGGDDVRSAALPPDIQEGGRIRDACPGLIRSTLHEPGPAWAKDECGTSFAAPKVTRIAAFLQEILPEQSSLLYRALIVQSARWPVWAEALLSELRQENPKPTKARHEHLINEVSRLIRSLGYGIPALERATTNSDYRTTFITDGDVEIRAGGCHIYQIRIPPALRGAGDEYDVRIEATLSYVAQPRRTRRKLRRYLSTWVDWTSSKLGEGNDEFHERAIEPEQDSDEEVPDEAADGALVGSVFPWTVHEKNNWGYVRNSKRNAGTVQKDWATVKSNRLADHFSIAVRGHVGWSRDPDSAARYSLAVTLEIVGQEIPIYESLRVSTEELRNELEAEVPQEAEIEIEE